MRASAWPRTTTVESTISLPAPGLAEYARASTDGAISCETVIPGRNKGELVRKTNPYLGGLCESLKRCWQIPGRLDLPEPAVKGAPGLADTDGGVRLSFQFYLHPTQVERLTALLDERSRLEAPGPSGVFGP